MENNFTEKIKARYDKAKETIKSQSGMEIAECAIGMVTIVGALAISYTIGKGVGYVKGINAATKITREILGVAEDVFD